MNNIHFYIINTVQEPTLGLDEGDLWVHLTCPCRGNCYLSSDQKRLGTTVYCTVTDGVTLQRHLLHRQACVWANSKSRGLYFCITRPPHCSRVAAVQYVHYGHFMSTTYTQRETQQTLQTEILRFTREEFLLCCHFWIKTCTVPASSLQVCLRRPSSKSQGAVPCLTTRCHYSTL